MDKLKDPSMVLSVANSAGLVGITAYFYKQLEAQRLDMIKMQQTIQGLLRKLSEIEKGEQNKSETLHLLNDQIKKLNEQVEDMPSLTDTENLDLDIDEITNVLSENNITIERPSQKVRYKKKSNKYSDFEDRDRKEVSRGYSRGKESHKSSRNETKQESVKSVRTTHPPQSYEDDSDLIGEVRRQQTRN